MIMSYNNPAPEGSALVASASWIRDVLTGSLAVSIAVVAIAWLGFAIMQGRLPWRSGLRIVLGCFILFGSSTIATAFMWFAGYEQARAVDVPASARTPAVPVPPAPPVFDPYAGASVPNH
jgi:type IV secretory pathway VirB2 component (pilin)